MLFHISNHDGTSDSVVNAKRHIARNIAECLTDNHHVPVEEAINAGSWCELACVGEVYEGKTFRIEVDDR
jgi:hypothetical protein